MPSSQYLHTAGFGRAREPQSEGKELKGQRSNVRRAKKGWNGQSMIRSCRETLTPDTARPSFRNRSLSCGFVRVLMSAVRCGISETWPDVAIAVEIGG